MPQMIISDKMFKAALENQKAKRFMHFPVPSPQKACTGTHMKIEPKTVQAPYTASTASMVLQIFCVVGILNTRKYEKTIDSLQSNRARL